MPYLNDRLVTEQEIDAWFERRKEIFGADYFDFANWGGKAPAVRTNDTFMRGKKQGVTTEDMSEDVMEEYRREAARHGVSTQNKFYFGSLATRHADPEAWCSSEDDVVATAKRKKMAIDINGKKYDFRENRDVGPQEYAVSDDIVDRYTQQRIEEVDPKLANHPEQVAKVREQIRAEITPTTI